MVVDPEPGVVSPVAGMVDGGLVVDARDVVTCALAVVELNAHVHTSINRHKQHDEKVKFNSARRVQPSAHHISGALGTNNVVAYH